MFCELVETLCYVTALLQQVSHSLWKVKCKQLLYIRFITSTTMKNLPQCKLLTFMYMSTDNSKLELKEVELEGADWIYVAEGIDQLLACRNMKMKILVA